jgi:sulfite dehydrogenase (cytochrome) subunit B
MPRALVPALLVLALAGVATAADKTISLPPDDAYATLAPGPGAELTQRQCVLCHSTDYIVMQPRGGARQWEAVVTKMIKVFGAPADEADAKTIVEYLSTRYGN